MERTSGGDLFLAVLPLAFAIFSISWPQAIPLLPSPGPALLLVEVWEKLRWPLPPFSPSPHPDPLVLSSPDPHCPGSSAGGQSLPCGSAGHCRHSVQAPILIPLVLSSLIPIALGVLLVVNPFHVAQLAIMIFGAALVADGVSDLVTALISRKTAPGTGTP